MHFANNAAGLGNYNPDWIGLYPDEIDAANTLVRRQSLGRPWRWR